MTEAFDYSACRRTLPAAAFAAARTHGGSHVVASDPSGDDLTYRQLFTRAFILGDKLKPLLEEERYVAVMLPNSLGAMITVLALQLIGRVPCMLNFSSGEANILHTCRIATARTVLTSRLFILKGKFEALEEALRKEHRVIYLEDLRPTVTWGDKIRGALRGLFCRKPPKGVRPDDPAVVLFTSGSEGVPKGVALSHANILANIAQTCARLDLNPPDVVFNAMPVFHSFGLSVGMLMPLVRGVRVYFYPSPVQYRQIPEEVEKSRATIMLGTDTFYNGYARYAERHHFKNIRLAVAGAEKLKESTRLHWKEKLGVDILQGYGVTETSPVISVNTPEAHKPGTVGCVFPAIQYWLQPVEGIAKGGQLFVKGPNVMLGYFKADRPGIIQPQEEWYDTGDIVDIDPDGFITIQGRAKRFAKIAGEMVSLLAVEETASAVMHDVAHAAVAVADERRGEQVVLYTESMEMSREALQKYAVMHGIPEIALPRQVRYIEAIPRLGNGKIDYPALQKIAAGA